MACAHGLLLCVYLYLVFYFFYDSISVFEASRFRASKLRSLHFTHPVYVATRSFH